MADLSDARHLNYCARCGARFAHGDRVIGEWRHRGDEEETLEEFAQRLSVVHEECPTGGDRDRVAVLLDDLERTRRPDA